jgi:predicted enzyme related to lactoylglutathione lyase
VPIRELFHVFHIVDDFDAATQFYNDMFAQQVSMPKSWSDFDKRTASIGQIGDDFVIEIAEPSKADEDRDAPLVRFHTRFGEHFHSIAWFVDAPDVPPLFHHLRELGIRIAKPGGGLFPNTEMTDEEVPRTLFTHPRDTFGQLEFQALGGGPRDPRFQDGWSADYWRNEQPLRIQRTSFLTTVVPDVDVAVKLYEDAFAGKTFHREADAESERAYVFVGTETVVEFARPLDASTHRGQDLARNGGTLYGVTFVVADLDGAERHAEKCGAKVAERAGDTVVLDPATCFGAEMAFTTRRLPNDPRDAG